MADPVERLQAALLHLTCDLTLHADPALRVLAADRLRELAQGIDDVADELAELRRSA